MFSVLVTACYGPSGASVVLLLQGIPDVEVYPVDAAEGMLPLGSDPDYRAKLEIFARSTDLIIPCSDEEALALAEDPRSSTHPVEGIRLMRDKAALYTLFQSGAPPLVSVPVPQFIVGPFIKRRTSRGGQGAYRIDEDQIACEYLPGEEYSVDLLRWREEIRACVVRRRVTVVRGICVVGEVVFDSVIDNHARYVARRLGVEGPLNIQFKRDTRGLPVLTDVNPRCGGGVTISAQAGVNIPRLFLQCWRGEPVPPVIPIPGVYTSLIARTK